MAWYDCFAHFYDLSLEGMYRSYRQELAEAAHLGPDSTVRTDTTSPADVTLTMDYAIAAAIARGDRSAQDAFMAGELRLGGDAMALVRANEHLEAATDPFAALRAETTYRDA